MPSQEQIDNYIANDYTIDSVDCILDDYKNNFKDMGAIKTSKLFFMPRAYATGKLPVYTPSDGSGDFTTTRALDTATRFNSEGIRETVLANVPRIDHSHGTCGELLVEPTRINLFVSPDTLATQNVTTAANYYAVSFEGTGTVTFSGTYVGSLVGTGVSNRVSLVFLATAGTLTCTVSGSVTSAQIELGKFATSYVVGTRNADVHSVNLPSGTLQVKEYTYGGGVRDVIPLVSPYTIKEGFIQKIIGTSTKDLVAGDFVANWDTREVSAGSSNYFQVKLPIYNGGTYNFTADWGDGTSSTITAWNQAEVTHTYSVAGVYTVKLRGNIDGWFFNFTGDRLKIGDVAQWGTLKVGNLGSYFAGCERLNASTVSDQLNVSETSYFRSFFHSCYKFTCDISAWGVSQVTDFSFFLYKCYVFNSDLSAWNVSSATTMERMLQECYAYNSSMANWNVSNVLSFANFMNGKTTANYSTTLMDALYNGWSLLTLKPNVVCDFGTIQYTAAGADGRAIMIGAPNNWTITSGTQI